MKLGRVVVGLVILWIAISTCLIAQHEMNPPFSGTVDVWIDRESDANGDGIPDYKILGWCSPLDAIESYGEYMRRTMPPLRTGVLSRVDLACNFVLDVTLDSEAARRFMVSVFTPHRVIRTAWLELGKSYVICGRTGAILDSVALPPIRGDGTKAARFSAAVIGDVNQDGVKDLRVCWQGFIVVRGPPFLALSITFLSALSLLYLLVVRAGKRHEFDRLVGLLGCMVPRSQREAWELSANDSVRRFLERDRRNGSRFSYHWSSFWLAFYLVFDLVETGRVFVVERLSALLPAWLRSWWTTG